MKLWIGAYAASPCHSEWKPELEEAFFEELARIPGIAGLELPFYGAVHRLDPSWLLDHLRPEWDYVITCIPGTMDQLKVSPKFGLASEDEAGRREALEFADRARLALLQIHQRLGRRAVRAVEIHSAPKLGDSGVHSSSDAFARSLQELRSWDWEGAYLLVEHCDHAIQGQVSAKGFLSLEDEIAAIQKSARAQASGSSPMGILINWGRSAIEGRSPETPASHLRLAREAGLLEGLIFSGCTMNDPLYGNWADSHAPFGGAKPGCIPTSLLTSEKVKEALRVADPKNLLVLGLKIQPLPQDLPLEERVERVRQWVAFLARSLP